MLSFAIEMWSWFALTVSIVGARILSRRLLFKSFKALQSDDWLMLFTVAVFMGLVVIIWIQTYTPSNLINPADDILLTPDDYELREYGSKLVLVTEHMQMIVIWSCKVCLLILYSRLTVTLKHNLMVKVVAWYVGISYVVMVALWFVWCRPFHLYWHVPAVDDLNCSAETNHMITNAVFNISTDILIISLPMPVLYQSQLPLKRKLTLAAVFALGSFTILAAILSKYHSLASPYGTQWIYWYMREMSVGIITANLPLTWTLLQRIFGMGKFFSTHGKSSAQGTTGKSRLRSAYGNLNSHRHSHFGGEDGKPRKRPDPHAIDISPSESQEQINSGGGGGGGDVPLKIWQHHQVQVTTEELDSRDDLESLDDDGARRKEILEDVVLFPERNRQTGAENGRKLSGDLEMGVSTKVSHGP
ncbi:hypothetical protein K504DRAFT_423216 [Pleomassaria siparia CBS 279.74]|uniref:Rhodopsin domain-containing protein n=1 Tax=Pleomassaria siparia CBS 279.74 TaxID=1314801 RepID=A0A6G1KJG3_9PLEO|nr:hypothetical protein K504DRAFT_423216 [Pleomassaria siparia CBS 279.74]